MRGDLGRPFVVHLDHAAVGLVLAEEDAGVHRAAADVAGLEAPAEQLFEEALGGAEVAGGELVPAHGAVLVEQFGAGVVAVLP